MSQEDNHEYNSDNVKQEDECVPSSSEDSQDGVPSPMENGDEPEFSQKHYDIEPCYYSMTGKSDRNCRGKVYRYRDTSDLKGFQAHDGTMYRLRDSVFVEQSQNEPYMVAAICGFKYTKRENVSVKLTRYYRADDIPEDSLNLMKQERSDLEINPNLCPVSLNRELFSSEVSLNSPVSVLRGKCIVEYVKDIRQARTIADFSVDNDTFFSCLHYNQDTTKLTSTHYAIRVGSSFQAKLPPMPTCSLGDEKDRDELLYRPDSIDEKTEQDYIKLARCFRAYTLSGNHMLDSQKNARVSDLLLDEAIIQLHRSGYKVDDALGELNANDIILTTDVDHMTQDDAKRFAKGIKQLGKNFTRINRELLPHHSREQLVSYYYLWKKTPEATKPKPLPRRTAPPNKKQKDKSKVSRPTSTEYLDFDSASESDVENNGPSGRACHHCYGAESKDWHHANGLLLCTDCRLHYKKYGQLRHVANRPTQVPACLFKRSNSDEEESGGVRTRAGKKEQRKRTPSSMSETPDRRSPSAVSNGAPLLTAEESPTKRMNGSAKRSTKRPLHNGLMNNVEKAGSTEPASPSSPPPKLTNGLTNGHAPGPSTPNGETVSKKMKIEGRIDEEDDDDDEECKMTIDEGDDDTSTMPVLNGFKKEESVEAASAALKMEVKEVTPETNGNAVEATTSTATNGSNGAENGVEMKVEAVKETKEATVEPVIVHDDSDDDDVIPNPEDTKDTFVVGDNVKIETQSSLFIETCKRSCGMRSIRTDCQYKIKEGSKYDLALKSKSEKKKHTHRTHEDAKAQMMKKEQQQLAQQQNQAHMQALQMQQIHALMMGAQLPPEVLRQLMPQQHFGMDPATAMLMQQLMHGQPPGVAALQQQMAMQQMHEQVNAHNMMRMQHELAHQQHQAKLMEQQRNQQAAAANREREQREREQRLQQQQAQQQALQQQQQQQAAAAAGITPAMMQQIMQAAANHPGAGNNGEIQRMIEMLAAQQAHAAQAQAQAAQQREQQERERRERELREQREREEAQRQQREREEAARREQIAREQAAREAQAQAQAQQQAAAQNAAAMDIQQQHQLMMLQQMMMNPQFMAQLQQQHAAQAQGHPQQAAQGQNALNMLQNPQAMEQLIRRMQAEGMRPNNHQ